MTSSLQPGRLSNFLIFCRSYHSQHLLTLFLDCKLWQRLKERVIIQNWNSNLRNINWSHTPTKNIHLLVGKTTAFDCEMVRKPSYLSDGPVAVKMKSQREDCLPWTLRVALVNGKIHINVTNTGQGELHIYRGQSIGVVDLRSGGYFHITRDRIQRCLHDRFIFINEEESQDYLWLMHTTNDKTLQKNTRLNIRIKNP